MHRSSPRALTIVFSCILLVAGARMVFGSESLTGSVALDDVAQLAIAVGIGLVAGFFAGLSGVGGGVVIVPAAVFLLGLSQHTAQGTSLVAIIFTAVSGTFVNLRNRRVRLEDGLVVGLGGVVGSPAGAWLALQTDERRLSLAFGLLVIGVALQSLYRVLSRSADRSSSAD
jgi:uncharacterized membrane protein YfcA